MELLRSSSGCESRAIDALGNKLVVSQCEVSLGLQKWNSSDLQNQEYSSIMERLPARHDAFSLLHLERNIPHKKIDWKETEDAKRIIEKVNAQIQAERIHIARAKRSSKRNKQGTARASFLRLLTTSKVNSDQRDWKEAMIQAYNGKHETGNWLWCPITHQWRAPERTATVQFFAQLHGQATMDSVFGKGDDILSPQNGLIISLELEQYFDAGKMAIVPSLWQDSTSFTIFGRRKKTPREFKIKILDLKWAKLDKKIDQQSGLTYRQLDNRPLVFRSSFRPAAEYLYLHFCVQVVRRAWQSPRDTDMRVASKNNAKKLLLDKNGKFCWGTSGHYLPRNILQASVEELGHGFKYLLNGSGSSKSIDSNTLLEMAANQTRAQRNSFSHDSDTMYE
ncbi:hypothetical protein N7454_003878 [Penicillium verhagenii]|nr:hypothetical protein N7454_003878 [Penicillium verhagenii]